MSDDVTNKRLDAIEARIAAVETRVVERMANSEARLGVAIGGLEEKVDETRSYLTGMEMRLATLLTGVAGSIADVKAFMVERDQIKARLDRIEKALGIVAGGGQ